MTLPNDCKTMADIRTEIDRIDVGLMAALAERARYIDRAAQIKTEIGLPARIPDRVEEVVANVGRLAVTHGLPPEIYQKMWRDLIDWSIAREERVLGGDKHDSNGD